MANSSVFSTETPQEYVSNDSLRSVTMAFVVILIPSFSVFGFVGNILSLMVLVHHKMRNSTNSCLAALAVSDMLVLVHSLLFASCAIVSDHDRQSGKTFRMYLFPFFGAYGSVVTARITSLLTTMLSVERFVAVYRPIKAKQLCIKKHAYIGIGFIYAATIILFIPFALKYKVVSKFSPRTNRTFVFVNKTEFGNNETFYTVYGNILNVLFRISPLVVIVVLNLLIVLAIRKTWRTRRLLSEGFAQNGSYEQRKITVMLLAVSCVFVVCILPGAVSSFCSQIWPHQYSRFGTYRNLFHCMSYVAFFLETVNSSINFIIYMALSQKFWLTYKEIFCFQKTTSKRQTPLLNKPYIELFSKRHRSSSNSVLSNLDTKTTSVRDRSSVSSNSSTRTRLLNARSVVPPERPAYRWSLDSISKSKMETLCSGRQLIEYERERERDGRRQESTKVLPDVVCNRDKRDLFG